jgi:hypothetical protein
VIYPSPLTDQIDAACDSDEVAYAIKHSRWYDEIYKLAVELEGSREEVRYLMRLLNERDLKEALK